MSTLTPIEVFANDASTVVASGGYTASSGVLNVSSTSSPFPSLSAGQQFHVLIYENSGGSLTLYVILKVTAINSGTQFAVTAEGTDSNAPSGATVVGVLTAAGMAQIKADAFQQNVDTVSFSATPNFDLSQGDQFIELTGNVTSSTFSNLQAGRRYIFCIQQDSVGERTFVWPTDFNGGMLIGTEPLSISIQEFWSPDGTNVYCVGAGQINL